MFSSASPSVESATLAGWIALGGLLAGLFAGPLFSQQEGETGIPPHTTLGICEGQKDELRCAQDLVAQNSKDFDLRKGFVFMLVDHHEFRRALKETDILIRYKPEDLSLLRLRASILAALGDPDSAAAERKRVKLIRQERWDTLLSEQAPDTRELHHAAYVAYSRNEWGMSRRLYDKYLAIVPDPPVPVLRDYARLLSAQKDHDAAIETLTLALGQTENDDFESRLALLDDRKRQKAVSGDVVGAAADAATYEEVVARFKNSRAEEAKRGWRGLLESSQMSDLPAILAEANNAAVARDLGTARKLYEHYFELADSTDPIAALGYARVLMGLKEYDSALDALTTVNREALEQDAQLHSKFLRTRALVKERMGDTDGSRADWLEREEMLESVNHDTTH